MNNPALLQFLHMCWFRNLAS